MGGLYENACHLDVCIIAPKRRRLQKNNNQRSSVHVQLNSRALTIANFTIDQPALLENHRVEKLASLCSASVCFFLVFDASKN
jgi:hypothetical protein